MSFENKFKGTCECGTFVPAQAGYWRTRVQGGTGKVQCATCVTGVRMPGGITVPDTDDGYDAWRDELVSRGTWGYRRTR